MVGPRLGHNLGATVRHGHDTILGQPDAARRPARTHGATHIHTTKNPTLPSPTLLAVVTPSLSHLCRPFPCHTTTAFVPSLSHTSVVVLLAFDPTSPLHHRRCPFLLAAADARSSARLADRRFCEGRSQESPWAFGITEPIGSILRYWGKFGSQQTQHRSIPGNVRY
jgi:hypothetical protein